MRKPQSPSVAARFSAAAHRYEQAAPIQKQVAAEFDAWLASQGAPRPARIAEIGCGTGFLTRLLHARYPDALLLATDLAPAMVDYCRDRLPHDARLQFAVRDGRNTIFDPAPDWIVSSMCFQWFEPLQTVLAHHLARSRVLAFSVMLESSFAAWRTAHMRVGATPGLHVCPNYARLQQICRQLGASRTSSHWISLNERHANGLSFMRSLRAIGADTPRAGHAPANLKPVLRQLEQGCDANYDIGFFYLER